MCNAWSAIVKKNGDVLWKFGMDSHSDILKHFNIPDNESEPGRLKFARIEISPANGNYLKPNEWKFKLDESITPSWWKKSYQIFAETEHKKWKKQLNKILINKEIVMPFSIGPPKKVLKKHIALLGAWASVGDSVRASVWDSVRASVWDSVGDSVGASVRDSVRASVWDSVRDSVGDSVRDSVRASVWDSVGDSVGDSVWASVGDSVRASVWDSVRASVWDSVRDSVGASVWAYAGSFLNLPRNAWKYTENIKTKKYPFHPLADLWEMGIVPSFDGKKWRLHAGKDAKIIFETSEEKLMEK